VIFSVILSVILSIGVCVSSGFAQDKSQSTAKKRVKRKVSKNVEEPVEKRVKRKVSKNVEEPVEKRVKRKVSKNVEEPVTKRVKRKVSKAVEAPVETLDTAASTTDPKDSVDEPSEMTKNASQDVVSAAVNQWARRARDTGLTPQEGTWSIGLFNPLKVQFAPTWGLEVHPIVALLSSPHVKLWHQWWSKSGMTLTGSYGFTTPSWSLQEAPPFGLAGYLSPTCLVRESEPERAPESCQRPGFDFVPQLGARLSGAQDTSVWTVEADIAVGIMVDGERSAPLDTYIPVDLAYAPTTHNYRAHLGARYAYKATNALSIQGGADLYITGQPDAEVAPERSPLALSGSASLDWSISPNFTLTLGAILWYADQRDFELVEDAEGFVTKESVNSLELYPTFDLIWRY
jgi:hypothetical protein